MCGRGPTPGVYIHMAKVAPRMHVYTWPGGYPGICVCIYICTIPVEYMFCGRGPPVPPVLPASIYVVSWSKLHASMGRGVHPRHGVR